MKAYWTIKNLIIVILLLVTSSMTNADELSGHIGGFIGIKAMDSSDWPDLDKHFSMGIIFDIKKDSWPISIVLDTMDTGGKHKHDGMEDLGHTTEHHIGVRKTFKKTAHENPALPRRWCFIHVCRAGNRGKQYNNDTG